MSFSWSRAASALREIVRNDADKPLEDQHLDEGQRASLTWMAERLPQNGVVLADEVGAGKTRIACAVVHAILEAGGRAAVIVPHGLMHQWITESRKLSASSPVPKELTTFTEFLRGENGSGEAPRPRPDESEWWLISHGFRAPHVRGNSPLWRAALPALVGVRLAECNTREDARTRIGKLHQYATKTTKDSREWREMYRIAEEIAPRIRVRAHRNLRERIAKFPELGITRTKNDALLAQFGNSGDGRHLTEELLGLWLGEFDLLVIDEAHKSRGEVDFENTAPGASVTVLARLVDVLLKQPENGRRVCLTATPMELDISQWGDLLERAHKGLRQKTNAAIETFHKAAKAAATSPDEGARLNDLVEGAQKFERELRPYVSRRRRIDTQVIGDFRRKLTDAEQAKNLTDPEQAQKPHPHRRLQRVQIPWTEAVGQSDPWLKVLFAAECMSQSAQGLTLNDTAKWPRAIREAYTKVSAGHLSIDLSEMDEPLPIPDADTTNKETRSKIARVAYWYKQLMDGRRQVLKQLPSVDGAEFDPDAEHPRILAAVKEIEDWTLGREKVLVFGVFLRPLRLLRNVLNVRHALRAADTGKPIARAIHTDPALCGLAFRHLERLREEGALSRRLATGSFVEMKSALEDSHKAYNRLRGRVVAGAKKQVAVWCTDPTLLGGTPRARKLAPPLEAHLVSFVLDDFLATDSEREEGIEARFDELTTAFLEERLLPLLGELGNDAIGNKQSSDKQREGNEEDRITLRTKSLEALFNDDNGLQSAHARLLEGETAWQTRRYLQAAFNRPSASPWVLIAQSQVGREGLNLHESCRVVVQFHAEWNPAVLEQQIGRVDRKGSLWERNAQEWLANGAEGDPPFIEIRQLIFEGTYDAFQWERVMRRQHVFDASLFGSLLPADAWDRVPEEWKAKLRKAAPGFTPR